MNVVRNLILFLVLNTIGSVFSMDVKQGNTSASVVSSESNPADAQAICALISANTVSEAERAAFITVVSGLRQQLDHIEGHASSNSLNSTQEERDKGVYRTFKRITPKELLLELGAKLIENVIENCPLRLQFEIENIKNASRLLGDPAFSRSTEMQETINKNSHGILLKGEPGVGKSTIAKAIAVISQRPCYFLCGTELGSHYANAGLKALDELFDPLIESDEPCIVIFDEIVSLTERFDNQNSPDPGLVRYFWSKFDACKQKSNILIIGNSNDDKRLPAPLESRFGKSTTLLASAGTSNSSFSSLPFCR